MNENRVSSSRRAHLLVDNSRDRDITPNERFWLEVIRLASWDTDPAPTLEKVQKLRRLFSLTLDGAHHERNAHHHVPSLEGERTEAN